MMPYNANIVEQYLAQQPKRREGNVSGLAYLLLSTIAALSFMGCEQQYRAQSQEGPLSRFRNPVNVSEQEISRYLDDLSSRSMNPEFDDMARIARR